MINKQQINIVNYIVVCINEFASRLNLSSKDAFDYLYKYNGINFLKENYEIEHTLSIDNAIDDIVIVCKNNGGYLDEVIGSIPNKSSNEIKAFRVLP